MAFFTSLRGTYKGLSFQNKLLFSYFALIFIPIVVLSVFFCYQSEKVITGQSMAISEMYLKQAYSEMDALVSKMVNQAQTVAQLEPIQKLIEKDPKTLTMAEQFEDVKELEEMVQGIVFAARPYQVRLFVNDQLGYSKRRVLTYPLSSANFRELEKMGEDYSRVYLAGPYPFSSVMSSGSVDLFSALFPIRSSKDYSALVGLVSVDFEKSTLLSILGNSEFTGNGAVYLVRQDGTLACGLDSATGQELTRLDSAAAAGIKSGEGVAIYSDTVLTAVSRPVWATWRIVFTSPVRDLLAPSKNLRWQLILFTLLVGVIVYFLAFFYARYNARRINTLAKKIRVVQTGDFNVNCVVDSADEIGELQSSFNVMVRRIRNLMQEQYYLGKNLKDSELKILQAQINPHFLYNTLDLILWTAKSGDPEKVSDIVVKLSRFYRLSLSNGSDFVAVRDELEHVRLYVQLQNLRFQSKIGLQIEAEEDTLDCRIMKLLLQPIVENSILHGIMNLDDRQGAIRIAVRTEGVSLVLQVEDNGVGMEHEKLMRLMAREEIAPEGSGGGYGLHNIFQRLRLYYGDEAHLTFRSEAGKGTVVEARIPLSQCQDAG